MMTPRRPRRLTTALSLCLAAALLCLTTANATAQNQEQNLLNDEQINMLHVYEVDLESDPPPKITIARDVMKKVFEEFQENSDIPRGKREQEDWLRETPGHKQLDLLFNLKATNYYKEVRIRSQIESLREWKTLHRRYVLDYFQGHFGDGDVEGLRLFGKGRESNRIEMTNFYILTQIKIDGRPMIDRHSPAESLLLQWGLPRESAKYPAPDVDRWQPYFKRGLEDERFKEMVDWVNKLFKGNQETDYSIEYKIPGRIQPEEETEE